MGEMKKREETLNTLQKCFCTYMRDDDLFCIISPKKGKLALFFKLIFIKQRGVFLNFCLKELKQLCTNNIT